MQGHSCARSPPPPRSLPTHGRHPHYVDTPPPSQHAHTPRHSPPLDVATETTSPTASYAMYNGKRRSQAKACPEVGGPPRLPSPPGAAGPDSTAAAAHEEHGRAHKAVHGPAAGIATGGAPLEVVGAAPLALPRAAALLARPRALVRRLGRHRSKDSVGQRLGQPLGGGGAEAAVVPSTTALKCGHLPGKADKGAGGRPCYIRHPRGSPLHPLHDRLKYGAPDAVLAGAGCVDGSIDGTVVCASQ